MKIKLKTLFIILIILSCTAFADQYPKIDVSGFKKWQYKDAKVSPQSNYFLGLTHLGGFSPTATGSPWQERLQLTILGQLTDKLTVSYDVEQQPDVPDKYDVRVNYDNKHELTFGDFSASFIGNEFASATKYLNGVKITSKDTNYDFIAVPSSKLKSQVQNLSTQRGNNTKGPYSLGHGSIIEGSEQILLNGVTLKKGTDYVIDYFEGKITFMRILTPADEFKYNFEFSNLLDLFFPALSKKDFFGVQGRFTIDPSTIGQKAPVPTLKTNAFEQYFPSTPKAAVSIEAATSTASDESTGRYKLSHFPVVPFSENIIFKGMVLKKNEDYTIKYDEGAFALLLPVLPAPDDRLQVTYKYYSIASISDNISGNGGRGPYNLTKANLDAKSESVLLDGRQVVRDYDYLIDYELGKITFNYNISTTSQIKVSYSYQVMELPPAPPPQKYPKSLTLGMTYLKESSKKGVSSATSDLVENRSGADIIKNDNTIYLSKIPVLSSAEGGTITVRINTKIVTPEIDYAIPTVEVDPATGNAIVIPQTTLAFITDRTDTSNGYTTGSIKILTSLEATSEVSVVYTYKKSIIGRFTGLGNGSRGPYYVKNYRNIVPGSERIDVWTTGSPITDTYIRNSSFEGNAGDKGYSLNYNQDSPFITFNKELQPTQNYSIYFQYIAPQANEGGDISQDLTGFDAALKFGEVLQFDGNYARSSTDQVINAVGSSDSFTNFAAPTNKITLYNKPVIENSEKVFVNNYLRNKDIDYFIDYVSGAVTFFYVTLSSKDVVSVDYQYQSSLGISLGEKLKTDQAVKYGIKSVLGKVSVAYNDKQVGFDFNPLGGTAVGAGSNYKDFTVALAPVAQDFQTSYTYRETNNPIGTTKKFYSRNFDRTYSAGINPYGLAKIDLGFRNSEVKGDPLVVGGQNTADNSLNSYAIGISPIAIKRGQAVFSQRYDIQRSSSEDRLGLTKGKIESGHVNYALGLTDRIKLSTDFQVSEPLTYNTQTGETKVAWSLSRDISYDTSVDLTFAKIKKLTTYAKLINHEFINYLQASGSKVSTKNTTYHVDFTPVDAISANYDYNRQETPTVVVEGKNPKSERAVTNININPHSAFTSGWSHADDLTINESARESSGNSDTYRAGWTPISFEKIKLTSNYSLFGRIAISPLGTLESKTNTRSFVQDYSVALTPSPIISITPGFAQEEYYNLVSTSPAELRTSNKTIRCKVNFKPLDKLSIDADYNLKVTTNVTDNINRHKNWESFRSAYKVFSSGEFVYSLEEEHNQGEVQAGGVLPDIDYLKTTNSFILNFNVPQDNPILTSILLSASYKLVKFENRMRPTDNLVGYLMSFEGTLNF